MSEPAPDIFEEDQLLARAARMDFAFAERLHTKALATEDTAELSDLARAYTRLTRSLRQTLALLSKLRAERARAERETPRASAQDLQDQAIDERTAQVQDAVERVISAAADGDEALHTDWCHRFDREVDDWNEKPDWIVDDVDAVIRRVCKTLGLPDDYAQRWRDLPAPTFFPDPEPATPEDVAAANAAARAFTAGLRPMAPDPAPRGTSPRRPHWRPSG
ncbi:hypothetical protein [Phenylobacterium sp.]|uniref:hypothetical protein n=1 Tax=Phenylobacterium sp. TaxID=1871053 RepID=UPI003D271D04